MSEKKELQKKELGEDTMIIGNKPEYVFDLKTNQTIPTEPYLRPILSRLSQYGHVRIKLLPHPDKLAKVSQIYEVLKWFGIREIYGSRKFVYEKGWNPNSNDEVKILVVKWEMIDRLKKYKDELLAEIKDESS